MELGLAPYTHLLIYTHTLVFSVFSNLILATDLTQWIRFSFCGHPIAHWLTLHIQTHSAIYSASPCTAKLLTNSSLGTRELDWLFFKTTLQAPNRKENTISNNSPIVVCLLISCLETGSIVACVVHFGGTCLPSRCLAMTYSGFQASCHIALSLRPFVPTGLQVYRHFSFSEGYACYVCDPSHLSSRDSGFPPVFTLQPLLLLQAATW
jgi:hypothetical protein